MWLSFYRAQCICLLIFMVETGAFLLMSLSFISHLLLCNPPENCCDLQVEKHYARVCVHMWQLGEGVRGMNWWNAKVGSQHCIVIWMWADLVLNWSVCDLWSGECAQIRIPLYCLTWSCSVPFLCFMPFWYTKRDTVVDKNMLVCGVVLWEAWKTNGYLCTDCALLSTGFCSKTSSGLKNHLIPNQWKNSFKYPFLGCLLFHCCPRIHWYMSYIPFSY